MLLGQFWTISDRLAGWLGIAHAADPCGNANSIRSQPNTSSLYPEIKQSYHFYVDLDEEMYFVVTERVAEFIANLPKNDNGPKVVGKAVASTTETPYVRLMKDDFCPGGHRSPRQYTWIERVNNVAASQSLIRINTDLGPALALQIQFRPANGWVVEPTGGLIGASEEGAHAAVRETKEEKTSRPGNDYQSTRLGPLDQVEYYQDDTRSK